MGRWDVPSGDEHGAAVADAEVAAGPRVERVGVAGGILDDVGAGVREDGGEGCGRAAAEGVGVQADQVGEFGRRRLWGGLEGRERWRTRHSRWGVSGALVGCPGVGVARGRSAVARVGRWATRLGPAGGGGGVRSRRRR